MNALPTFDISITEGASYDLLVTLAENGVGSRFWPIRFRSGSALRGVFTLV